MQVTDTFIQGVKIITPQVFGDGRGWFFESYSYNRFLSEGIDIAFVQDNHSYNAQKGTLRGLHYQKAPMAQTKLLRCTRGEILDVAVDLRKNSPTYKQWFSIRLTGENKLQLLIPKGCAHGYVTLCDDCEIEYKVDVHYAPEYDRSIRYDDPELAVDWGISNPLLSAKDEKAPFYRDSDADF